MQENSQFSSEDHLPFLFQRLSSSNKILFISSNHLLLNHLHHNSAFLGVKSSILSPKFSHYINHEGLNSQKFLKNYIQCFERQESITFLHSSLLTMPLPEPDMYSCLKLTKGSEVAMTKLSQTLSDFGYINSGIVYNSYEFAIRGYIVDFSDGEDFIRIEYLGNKIEEIKLFNPQTQRSLESISQIIIYPSTFLLKSVCNFTSFNAKYQVAFQEENAQLCFAVQNHGESCDINKYAKLLANTVNILDILDGEIFLHNTTCENVANYQEIIFFEQKNNIPHGAIYFSQNEVLNLLSQRKVQTIATF